MSRPDTSTGCPSRSGRGCLTRESSGPALWSARYRRRQSHGAGGQKAPGATPCSVFSCRRQGSIVRNPGETLRPAESAAAIACAGQAEPGCLSDATLFGCGNEGAADATAVRKHKRVDVVERTAGVRTAANPRGKKVADDGPTQQVTAAMSDAHARIGAGPLGPQRRAGLALN
jgi:hypothetical protein